MLEESPAVAAAKTANASAGDASFVGDPFRAPHRWANTRGRYEETTFAAEMLAEAGYVVLYAEIGGNSVDHTIDATDFFVATREAPTARGEFNPWYEPLDRNRLGIVGHSGAGGVALTAEPAISVSMRSSRGIRRVHSRSRA